MDRRRASPPPGKGYPQIVANKSAERIGDLKAGRGVTLNLKGGLLTLKYNVLEFVPLVSPIPTYVPVYEGKISIAHKELDGLGRFSKFVLKMIGDKVCWDLIQEVTLLEERVVDDEAAYLSSIGLAAENQASEAHPYQLTKVGADYHRLLNWVNQINAQEIRAHINGVTGEIMPPDEAALSETELGASDISIAYNILYYV